MGARPCSRRTAVREAAREARVDLLVVATDVYTWKQLRRDRGLDRGTTTQRIHELVAALIPQE